MAASQKPPVPPPHEPPMAEDSPERLTLFIYQVARDLLPPGYMEGAVSLIDSGIVEWNTADPELRAWADKLARRILVTWPPD